MCSHHRDHAGTVLPTLAAWADECGFTLLDYEWGGSVITDDDKQFFDGFIWMSDMDCRSGRRNCLGI